MNQSELLHQAAEAGDTDAMWELRTRYLEGNQLTQDAQKVEKWLRNADEVVTWKMNITNKTRNELRKPIRNSSHFPLIEQMDFNWPAARSYSKIG